MKILIIGGVAAGTKVAAKLKRLNRDDEITIITKDTNISYAGCGLPYYVGGLIKEKEQLIVNTKEKFYKLTGVKVLTHIEATRVDINKKEVIAKNFDLGKEEVYNYDKLIIASGASPIVPNIEGVNLEGVYQVRTPEDAINIRAYINKKEIKEAVVVGASFIGLEMAENLMEQNIKVTVVDLQDQILPNVFDLDFALYLRRHLENKGVKIITGTKVLGLTGTKEVTGVNTDKGLLNSDLVILSIGIKANTSYLENSGIELEKGKVVVNKQMETNVKDVYAIGDCALVYNRITNNSQYSPMGSSANLEGRKLARIINGENLEYKGVLGTGVIKLPGVNAGRTGLTEVQAKALNIDYLACTVVVDDKAHYYPGASIFIIKLICDKKTHKLLGTQVIGTGNIDKIVDIAVTGINLNATLEDFEDADYAYAPPFSTAIHPFVNAVNVTLNKLVGVINSMTPLEFLEGKAKDYEIIDANINPTILGKKYVDLVKVNGEVEGLDKNGKYLLVCARGKRAYLLQNRLKYYGYKNTLVLEGSTTVNKL